MPYVSRELLRLALDALAQNYSPLLTISLPCMLSRGIPTASSAAEASRSAIRFGSGDERTWLDSYFRPGGGPPSLPYYLPGTKEWVQERYPGRSLQRRRNDFDGSVFYHPTDQTWALTPSAATALREKVLGNRPTVPLAALMIWMWRDRELSSLDAALDAFIREIRFDRDQLIGQVYDRTIPAQFIQAGVSESVLPTSTIAELIGAAPPPPTIPDLAVVIASLEAELRHRYVQLVPGLVRRIVEGWLVGDVVVLVGAPGTGKTFLANRLGESLAKVIGTDRFWTTQIEINRDFDVGQFIGYENLAGEFTPGRFAREVLFEGAPSDPRLVILDEWNLAQIDAYFSPILSVLETGRLLSLPGKVDLGKLGNGDEIKRAFPDIEEGRCTLPEDTLFLATCNSWADEPETRLPVSGPVKRRCRIIQVANVLETKYKAGGQDALSEVCDSIIRRERSDLEARATLGRRSLWDQYRATRLNAVPSFAALNEPSRQLLLHVSRILLESPQTKAFYTIGILRDVLLGCVYAEPGQEATAFGQQIADKVLHQVQGDPKLLERIVEVSRDLPNVEEIREAARRMGAFGAERRIRPLL